MSNNQDDIPPMSGTFEVKMMDQNLTTEELQVKKEKFLQDREKKRQQMMDAMAKRRLNRTHQADKQQNQQIDSFDAEFNNEMDNIESELENKENTFEKFKELKMQAFQLESKLASAAKFLPNYTFERKSKQIQQLKDKISQTQQNVAPRPKFRLNRDKTSSDGPTKNNSNETKDENNHNEVSKTSEKGPGTETQTGTEIGTETETEAKTKAKTETETEIEALQGNTNEVVISHRSNEEIEKMAGSVNGSDVWLSDLTNCKIRICDNVGALRMNNIDSCTIIIGPISTSLHVENISNSQIHAMMRQCRIHDAKDTKFYIHVNSEPVIENSKGIQFGIYAIQYKCLHDHITKSGVDKDVNFWDKVKDFNWFKQQQSPNWSLLPPHERSSNVTLSD